MNRGVAFKSLQNQIKMESLNSTTLRVRLNTLLLIMETCCLSIFTVFSGECRSDTIFETHPHFDRGGKYARVESSPI